MSDRLGRRDNSSMSDRPRREDSTRQYLIVGDGVTFFRISARSIARFARWSILDLVEESVALLL